MGFPDGASSKRIGLPMQEMWVRFLGWEDPLEKEMAIHAKHSCLKKIPLTEQPDGLLSMGSQRVRIWLSNNCFQRLREDFRALCLHRSGFSPLDKWREGDEGCIEEGCLWRHKAASPQNGACQPCSSLPSNSWNRASYLVSTHTSHLVS